MAFIIATCAHCGARFMAQRQAARYCGGTCRQRARRARGDSPGREGVARPPVMPLTYARPFLESVRAEFSGRDDPHALLALSLAEDAVDLRHPPSARRMFANEFVKAYKQARVGSRTRVDELRQRRLRGVSRA